MISDKKVGGKKSFMIAQHLPNQTRVVKLIIQTKPFQLTRPNTKPYRGQRGQKSNNFSGIVSFQVVTSEEEDGDERKEREKGGFQLQQEIQVSLKGHFVGLISYPREQLLSIKMKLENLQSEYGCSSNFLLIFEDNVTEKVNPAGKPPESVAGM